MNPLSIVLQEIKILESGFAGGFIYLFGRADFAHHGIVDVYAYFVDLDEENKTEEERFREAYSGGDLIVSTDVWEYHPSTGLSLKNIRWEKAEPVGSPKPATRAG